MRPEIVRPIRRITAAVIVLAAGAAGAQTAYDAVRLEMRLQKALVERLGPDAKGVKVAVSGRKAFLTGTVDKRVTQELSKEVVLSFPEINSASNRIELHKIIGLAEGQAFLEGQDAELGIRVHRALKEALGDEVKALEIEVVDGVVSLRGPMRNSERRSLALTRTKETSGVRDVLDLITLR